VPRSKRGGGETTPAPFTPGRPHQATLLAPPASKNDVPQGFKNQEIEEILFHLGPQTKPPFALIDPRYINDGLGLGGTHHGEMKREGKGSALGRSRAKIVD